ncbi:hypothetical protein DFH11DRAFT_854174 [Phellopilus nigrolimitatus]|nr:hypothetical protein DFH11DRAFT_854174 [Phellopilus nigrolimitatus]
MQGDPLDGLPDISVSALAMPRLDVTSVATEVQQGELPTDLSLSADKTHMEVHLSDSASRHTEMAATTSGVETLTLKMPEVDVLEGSEIDSFDPLDEETAAHLSNKSPSPVGSITRTSSDTGGRPLSVTHALALKTFPSAFAPANNSTTDDLSAPEKPRAASMVESNELSPPTPRRRLESTTSTLYFPGGWVTSPSHHERPSLEVATGEFSKPLVEGGPAAVVAPATPIAKLPPTDEEEKKWRCVIM